MLCIYLLSTPLFMNHEVRVMVHPVAFIFATLVPSQLDGYLKNGNIDL